VVTYLRSRIPAALALGDADLQLLLGAGHGVVGGGTGGVAADGGVLDLIVDAVAVPVGSVGVSRGLVFAAIVEAVVGPQLLLLGLRQVLVRGRPGGVLDQLLLVASTVILPIGIVAAAVVLFGLHLMYQQQRAGYLVLQPPAA
jgi:hypothetical protein